MQIDVRLKRSLDQRLSGLWTDLRDLIHIEEYDEFPATEGSER